MSESQLDFTDFRRCGIGGSDAPAIMGVSPWRDSYDVWEEKALGVSKTFDSPAMQYGRENEERARKEFEDYMGVVVAPCRLVSPVNTWLRGNFDGLDFDKKVLVEIKNIYKNKADHDFAKQNKKPPEKYYPQCQHYIKVMNDCGHDIQGMYYMSNFHGDKVIIEVPRDDAYIATMFAEEQALWDMVLSKTPPVRKETKYAPLEGVQEAEEAWAEAKAMVEKWEAEERRQRAALLIAAGNQNARGSLVQIQRSTCQGAVDYKKAIDEYMDWLRETYPETEWPEIAFEKYRKDSFTKYTLKAI